ncbi:MAG TPA: M28 family peptidase [Candidatus Polarisedimenticolia bacterium]|nr:M28 family peptidase [Candidatus Polarisedimenticolia bacterium]
MRPARIAATLAAAPAILLAAWAAVSDPMSFRVRTIADEALKVPTAYARLQVLTDTIGARLAGSEAEARAVAWARAEFERDGVPARLEQVMVPVWVRGEESAVLESPSRQPLVILGLGGTVGTPPDGVAGEVVVVSSFEELAAMGRAKVEGRIVLYDAPFTRTGDEMRDYGIAVRFRGRGASEAAKLGAAAALVRSVATSSLRSPHTGALGYAADAPKIPAAAVSVEDAMLLRRLAEAGHAVRVRLRLGARTEPDRPGANVVAELAGRERPEEIVLIGAHLDSWDVGTGAIDDGAGCAMVLETMRLLASGPRPRRTVRAVLYANEENGLRGGRGYREAHEAEMERHVAAVESDSGAGRALGFTLKAGDGGLDLLRDMLAPALAPLGAARVRAGQGGADIGPLRRHGVPLLGLDLDTTRYFDWHHSMADTLDKVDPAELQQATAVLAAATWVLADAPRTLPRYPSEPDDQRRRSADPPGPRRR